MLKRKGVLGKGHERKDTKRLKTDTKTRDTKQSFLFASPEDLHTLLVFQQDNARDLILALEKFTRWIESIERGRDELSTPGQQQILREYLKSCTPAHNDDNSNSFLILVGAWSYAVQTHQKDLLAILLETFSCILNFSSFYVDLEDVGIKLCQTLLHSDHMKLIDYGLSANRSKEAVICAQLNLLARITSFGGGACAATVIDRCTFTCKRLDEFLILQGQPTSDGNPDLIRTSALHFVLANFRYQGTSALHRFLNQTRILRPLFQWMRYDHPDMIINLLDTIWQSILQNPGISEDLKRRTLTNINITSVTKLLDFSKELRYKRSQDVTAAACHFLLLVITSKQSDAYTQQPEGYSLAQSTRSEAYEDDGIRVLPITGVKRQGNVGNTNTKNPRLESILHNLRPYASKREAILVLLVFKLVPGLVADYFMKTDFSFASKSSATWINYSDFLLATIRLPMIYSQFEGDDVGTRLTPMLGLLESIMPQPMNRKTMTKALNQSNDLIKFITLRLLKASFLKLDEVVKYLSSSSRPQRRSVMVTLLGSFGQRCPETRHVIALYRQCPPEKKFLREMISNVLAMYHSLTPQLAAQGNFDVSMDLTRMLQAGRGSSLGTRTSATHDLETVHLTNIACISSNMRWWYRPEGTLVTPFTSLLRLLASNRGEGFRSIRQVVQSIIHEHSILRQGNNGSSLTALVWSLNEKKDWLPSDCVWKYLDDCILRLVRRPIKYVDAMEICLKRESASTPTDSATSLSLLTLVAVEQWSFLVDKTESKDLLDIATWLNRYLITSCALGDDDVVIEQMRTDLDVSAPNKSIREVFSDSGDVPTKLSAKVIESEQKRWPGVGNSNTSLPTTLSLDKTTTRFLESCKPRTEPKNHHRLHRWVKKDMVDAVPDGSIGDLFICLCSQFTEVRRQALINIKLIMAELETSDYINCRQLLLLAGELFETAKESNIEELPLLSFAATLAARGCQILHEPSHPLYEKLNKFLNRQPVWNCQNLPAHWLDYVTLEAPSTDNNYVVEVQWVLETLLEGLRTTQDMENYRLCGIFERLYTLSSSASLARDLKDTASCILQILARGTYLEYSRTLITRTAILNWLTSLKQQSILDKDILEFLSIRTRNTCQDAISEGWTMGQQPNSSVEQT